MTAILKSVYCSCKLKWSISQTLKVTTPVQFERAWFGVQQIAQTRLEWSYSGHLTSVSFLFLW